MRDLPLNWTHVECEIASIFKVGGDWSRFDNWGKAHSFLEVFECARVLKRINPALQRIQSMGREAVVLGEGKRVAVTIMGSVEVASSGMVWCVVVWCG